MRIIKLAFISFIFFSLLITGISFFFPSHIRISKAIDINSGKDALMAQVGDAANWKNWYPGADTLPAYVVDGRIKGIETGPGQVVMITGINDSTVLASNTGVHSNRGETGWNIFPGGGPNSFILQWYMDFHLRWYPWEKFSSLLLEKRYGPMMEKGLGKLKTLLEK